MQKIDDDSIMMSELIKKQEGRERAPYPDYDGHDYR